MRVNDLQAQDPYLENKLRNIFSFSRGTGNQGKETSINSTYAADQVRDHAEGRANLGDTHGWSDSPQATQGGRSTVSDTVTIDRAFFNYLTNLQRSKVAEESSASPIHLRELSHNPVAGELTHIDQNTIELLARMFCLTAALTLQSA